MPDLTTRRDVLRKRLLRLLGKSDSRAKDPTEVSTVILPQLERVGRLALIGGAVRDVARLGVKNFRSYLDFVLYDGNLSAFHNLMQEMGGGRIGLADILFATHDGALMFGRWRIPGLGQSAYGK